MTKEVAGMKEGRFGFLETVCLMSLILFTKDFYSSIRVVVETNGTAAWYMTLISCAVSLTFFLLLYLLMKRFPGKDLVQVFQLVLGKILGKVVALLFFAYFMFYAATDLREFLEMIKAYALPYTLPSLIIGAFIIAVLILASKGLEVIARVGYISFFPVMFVIILILLLASKYYDVRYLLPIGGYGFDVTLKTGFLRSSAYNEVIFLAFIINSIHGLKIFKKAGIISLVITGLTFSGTLVCYLMAFQYTQGSENLSAMYQLARIIYFNRFFQRIEAIFLFIWVISSIITVAMAFYISITVYCKAMNIKKHKPLLLPGAFILFMITILPDNLSEIIEISLVITRQYSIFFVWLVPVLVLIISLIFRKKGRGTGNAKT